MKILFVIFLSLLSFFSIKKDEATIQIKCMVQMIDYRGEGAYFVISVVDSNDNYLKTLYVMGNDKTWFSDMKAFWQHLRANELLTDERFYPLIDGISGATISGGQRRIFPLQIPVELLNKGNRLRFETAVEDKGYHTEDVALDLNLTALGENYQGSGFIQQIKFLLPES
jgi:hypothetical protein